MQRYIARRFLQSLLAIWVMSLIVFSLARVTGNPLDVMLPLEAGPEEYERVSKYWGLDQPLYIQYAIFLSKAVRGDFGNSWKWHGYSAMGLVRQRLRDAAPPQGRAGMAGHLETLFAARVDRPPDLLRDHRRCPDDGLRGDGKCLLLAGHRTARGGRREGQGLSGGPGRRDRVLR